MLNVTPSTVSAWPGTASEKSALTPCWPMLLKVPPETEIAADWAFTPSPVTDRTLVPVIDRTCAVPALAGSPTLMPTAANRTSEVPAAAVNELSPAISRVRPFQSPGAAARHAVEGCGNSGTNTVPQVGIPFTLSRRLVKVESVELRTPPLTVIPPLRASATSPLSVRFPSTSSEPSSR